MNGLLGLFDRGAVTSIFTALHGGLLALQWAS